MAVHRRWTGVQVRALIAHKATDWPVREPQETRASLTSRLRNETLTDGQRHQLRTQLRRMGE